MLRIGLMGKQHVSRGGLHHDAGLGIQVILAQRQGRAFVKIDGRLKAVYAQIAHEQVHQARRGHAVQAEPAQPQLDHALLEQPHGRFGIVAIDAVGVIGKELQVDQPALQLPHTVALAAQAQGAQRGLRLRVKQKRQGIRIGLSSLCHIIACSSQKALCLLDPCGGLLAVDAVGLARGQAQRLEAFLQFDHRVACIAGGERLARRFRRSRNAECDQQDHKQRKQPFHLSLDPFPP